MAASLPGEMWGVDDDGNDGRGHQDKMRSQRRCRCVVTQQRDGSMKATTRGHPSLLRVPPGSGFQGGEVDARMSRA